jgi:hypothetical protein
MYILLNDGSEISLESAVESSETNVTESSVGGADDESVTVTTEPKEWPKGGFDSFKNEALPSLIFGMLGIFMVLGLIALATMALNKLFPGDKN